MITLSQYQEAKKIVEEYEAQEQLTAYDKFVLEVESVCYGESAKKFIDYWTEKSDNGRKMRFQKEKVFNIKRRLNTWLQNEKRWNKTTSEPIRTDWQQVGRDADEFLRKQGLA